MQTSRAKGSNTQYPAIKSWVVSRVTISGDTGSESISRNYLVNEHRQSISKGSDKDKLGTGRAPPASLLRSRYIFPIFLACVCQSIDIGSCHDNDD